MAETKSNPAELAGLPSAAKNRLALLFDEGKYTELDAYVCCADKLCGAVSAFGYVEGNPCYAFSQDSDVNKGAMNKAQADKITRLYKLAAKTGVPVVGFYDSDGADLTDGFGALNAYGELTAVMNELSGVVPQIAIVSGVCSGTAALFAESADIAIVTEKAELYCAPNSNIKSLSQNALKNGTAALGAADDSDAAKKARALLSKLPLNNLSPIPVFEFDPPASTETIEERIADDGSIIELYADYGKASSVSLASIGGAAVGIVSACKKAKLGADDCAKIARFVKFCDCYSLPIVTLVDTDGFEANDETEAAGAVKSMAALSAAYAEATTVKISAVTGKACGTAFIALAGKGANADLVYACEGAVIAPLDPLTAAEFLCHDELRGAADVKAKREELAANYARTEGSAVTAAANGSIDGVVSLSVLRDVIVNSIEITAGKRVSNLPKKHGII